MPPPSAWLLTRRLIVGSFIVIANVAQVESDIHSTVKPTVMKVDNNNQDTVGSCIISDLESQYGRLMGLPVHLHPSALNSEITSDWNDDEEQEVWLCPDQSSPSERRRVDFHNGLDCEDMELLFSLYTSSEVYNKNLQAALGFDYQSWCKCPGAKVLTNLDDDDRTCGLCPDGQRVR